MTAIIKNENDERELNLGGLFVNKHSFDQCAGGGIVYSEVSGDAGVNFGGIGAGVDGDAGINLGGIVAGVDRDAGVNLGGISALVSGDAGVNLGGISALVGGNAGVNLGGISAEVDGDAGVNGSLIFSKTGYSRDFTLGNVFGRFEKYLPDFARNIAIPAFNIGAYTQTGGIKNAYIFGLWNEITETGEDYIALGLVNRVKEEDGKKKTKLLASGKVTIDGIFKHKNKSTVYKSTAYEGARKIK